MKSLTGKYFIVGVRYEKTLEDGTNAKTTEQYVVDALSWSECEAKTTEEMAAYTNGDMEIVTMKKAGFSGCSFRKLIVRINTTIAVLT